MKKILLAVALVSVAAISQGAAFSWSTKSTGSTGVLYSGNTTVAGAVTAYLIDAATLSQADAFAALSAGTFDTTKTVASTTLSTASKIVTKGVEYGDVGGSYDFYWVALLKDNKFYISSVMEDQPGLTSGTQPLQWSDVKSTSQTLKTGTTFGGAGVYEAAPEPTSGLLLLLGVAGLALKRKRA